MYMKVKYETEIEQVECVLTENEQYTAYSDRIMDVAYSTHTLATTIIIIQFYTVTSALHGSWYDIRHM
jgi:hypothetical protein